jgi:hypothetical protein
MIKFECLIIIIDIIIIKCSILLLTLLLFNILGFARLDIGKETANL